MYIYIDYTWFPKESLYDADKSIQLGIDYSESRKTVFARARVSQGTFVFQFSTLPSLHSLVDAQKCNSVAQQFKGCQCNKLRWMGIKSLTDYMLSRTRENDFLLKL